MTADIKSINIKNHYCFFFNDMMNIKVFNSSLLKIDKKQYKNIGIYNMGYIAIKKIDDYENIYSANPLYLIIGKVDGFIKRKMAVNIYFLILQMKKKGIRKIHRTLGWD